MELIGILLTVIGVGGLGTMAGRYLRWRRPLIVTCPNSVSPEAAFDLRDTVAAWDRRSPLVLMDGVTVAEFGP